MLYAGVDLHSKWTQVAVVDELGSIQFNKRIPSERDEVLRLFGELHEQPLKVVFEATYGWGWFADLLEDAGIDRCMAHPLQVKAIASARVKNDSVDAATLAHLLRAGLIPAAWIAPHDVREARSLVRSRISLVRMRSRLKNQIRAVLAQLGMSVQVQDIVGRKARLHIGELPLPPAYRLLVELWVRLADIFTVEIDQVEGELRRRYIDDARVARLMAIPGIGFLTAVIVIAEVGDVSLFRRASDLCSWAGLTPREHSSSDRTRRGHITKQGSRWLRWAMVEAAVSSQCKGEQLTKLERRVAVRRGRQIARVAKARKLLTYCYHALRDPQGCRYFPVAA